MAVKISLERNDTVHWILALVTTERMIAVTWPHLTKFYCTKSKAVTSISIVGIGRILLNCHVILTTRVVQSHVDHTIYYCGALEKY